MSCRTKWDRGSSLLTLEAAVAKSLPASELLRIRIQAGCSLQAVRYVFIGTTVGTQIKIESRWDGEKVFLERKEKAAEHAQSEPVTLLQFPASVWPPSSQSHAGTCPCTWCPMLPPTGQEATVKAIAWPLAGAVCSDMRV